MTFQLYNGDSLDFYKKILDGSVDLVCTDPPYASMGDSAVALQLGKKGTPRETQFYEAWFREHLKEWLRMLTPSGAAWFTIDLRGALCVDMACARG